MSRSTRKKPIKEVLVQMPTDPNEVARFIAQIGREQQAIDQIKADLNEEVRKLTEGAVERAEPHREIVEGLFLGILAYAQEHRKDLTNHGERKTVKLPTGELGWRTNPPSVRISNTERVIAALKELGLGRFIRITEEVNKEAILAERDAVDGVRGVSIKHSESFFVKPSTITVEVAREIPL